MSGKDFRRPRYQRLVKTLRPEDVLVVKSIDRLGRNYDEILEQWGVITKRRQAEGIAAAKAAGVRLGRERLALPPGFEEMARQWHEGGISAGRAAEDLGMSRGTFLRRAREYCAANVYVL